MLLTDTKVRSEKAATKTKTLNDGGGLQLEVKPTGSKLWRLRCTINGKRTRLSIGEYPAISLKTARVKRDEIKEQIANGIDPRIKDKPIDIPESKTFAQMVKLYLDHYRADRNAKYWEGVESLFRRDAIPNHRKPLYRPDTSQADNPYCQICSRQRCIRVWEKTLHTNRESF